MQNRGVYPIILYLSLINFLLISTSELECWEWQPDQFQRYSIHTSYTPAKQNLHVMDINEDGIPEQMILNDKYSQISVQSVPNVSDPEKTLVWQSPSDWEVKQAEFTDFDGDGKIELTLLVWREFKPWFIDKYIPYGGRIKGFHDHIGKSCHIILLHWHKGRLREKWAGSALVNPVLSFAAVDLNRDHRDELVTTEGQYSFFNQSRSLSVWRWEGFGFRLVNRLSIPFQAFNIIKDKQNNYRILAQR